MEESPIRPARGGVLLDVHATPKAREDALTYEGGILKVKVREPPDKGKANKAVLKALKPVFGACELVGGQTSRHKTVLVKNASMEAVQASLRALEGV